MIDRNGRYERNPAALAAEVGAVVGLAGTAYIHLAELSNKSAEVAYLGVGYVLLSAARVAAITMIRPATRRARISAVPPQQRLSLASSSPAGPLDSRHRPATLATGANRSAHGRSFSRE